VDYLISVLLRIARDKAFERLIKVDKHSHREKLQEINERHVIVLDALPSENGGGWRIPSQSGELQYLVVPAKEVCACNLRCIACQCCPHMYDCSCVDFAVHATVCKHVHTVHHLRAAALNMEPVAATDDDAPVDNTTSDAAEDIPEPMESESVPESSSTSREADISQARLLLHMHYQQLMNVASRCDDTEALQCALKHVQTAEISLHATPKQSATVSNESTVVHQMPANKKLDKEHRFCSTKVKRRPLQEALQKPSAAAITALKETLMQNASEDASATSVLPANIILYEVPYCV